MLSMYQQLPGMRAAGWGASPPAGRIERKLVARAVINISLVSELVFAKIWKSTQIISFNLQSDLKLGKWLGHISFKYAVGPPKHGKPTVCLGGIDSFLWK